MKGSGSPVSHKLHNAGSVWIDHPDRPVFFCDPVEILEARSRADLPRIYEALDGALAAGMYTAGFFSYDEGSEFLPVPLAWAGIYRNPAAIDPFPEAGDFSLRRIDRDEPDRFKDSVERIRSAIAEGAVYQVNYTERASFSFSGDPLSLYLRLRHMQHGRYAAYINTGTVQVLSFSPELFFAVTHSRDGARIESRPMKGTASPGHVQELRSEKNLSENFMIVDLMRNDIGRISIPGSVRVRGTGEITELTTALQMTSTVEGRLQPGPLYSRIFPALFPAGSITGAPKQAAMQMIARMEAARGAYTGTLGFAGPGNSGIEASYNVLIRTLVIRGSHAEYGSGCGIVWESRAEEEFREFQLKREFLQPALAGFCLIETMRKTKNVLRLSFHMRRLRASARAFGIPLDLRAVLERLKQGSGGRLRLTVDFTGRITLEESVLPLRKRFLRIGLARQCVRSGDFFRRHKTSHRELYDTSLKRALSLGLDDVLFLNERGEVAETAVRNVLLFTGSRWLTPRAECGALPGVFLAALEAQKAGRIERTAFSLEDLRSGRLFTCNSVRGIERAVLEDITI